MARSPHRGPAGWRRLLPRHRRGWLWVALTCGIVFNGLRLRRRLCALGRIPATGGIAAAGDQDDDFLLVHLPGVVVDDDTRREAMAHARAEGLEVLDLVPGDLPTVAVLDLARAVDARTYRGAPFAAGRGAGHALVASREVWKRLDPGAEPGAGAPRDRADMARLIERLKQHAAWTTDVAVAPNLHAVGVSPEHRFRELQLLYRDFTPAAVAIPALRTSLLLAGTLLSPGWGAAAATAFLLQPYLVAGGGPLAPAGGRGRPRGDGLVASAGRSLLEPALMLRAALTAGPARTADAAGDPADATDPIESRRPLYAELLADGIDRFFEPPRPTCPQCEGTQLVEHLRMPDWVQFKPGQFVLDRCERCGHIFQNPHLSLAGLDFYYRDAYDGLGARSVEFLFTQAGGSYRGRVDLVRRHATPRFWLDVGSGYGHFCITAKGSFPDTRFDGLDVSQSIEEAGRRRWVDHAYRGLFPDLADQLAGNYDLVSMHHYLEHTLDPWAELAAAARVLSPGGHLLIEVPDPESRFASLLGRAWLPWLQPQHLHFLSVANLEAALTARGFSMVEVERGPAHQPVDLAGGVLLRANALAPPRVPWRDPPTMAGRARRAAVLTAATPLAAVAMVADRGVVQPLVRTKAQRWSNGYRVLARREQ